MAGEVTLRDKLMDWGTELALRTRVHGCTGEIISTASRRLDEILAEHPLATHHLLTVSGECPAYQHCDEHCP